MALAGCGTVELFGKYDVAESPEVEATPYPRLVDVPSAPARGEFSAEVPDPAAGARVQQDLGASAVVAEVRREDLAGPVISDADRARMQARANRPRP